MLHNTGLRMHSPYKLWSKYEQAALVCATVKCTTLYRQAHAQIWTPNKFQFRTYFINNVYCTVTGFYKYSSAVVLFHAQETCR